VWKLQATSQMDFVCAFVSKW